MSVALPITPSARGPETFTASAGQTAFPGDYPLQSDGDVAVQVSTDAGANWSTLTLGTDYSVAGVGVAGGFTINLVTGRSAGDRVRHYGLAAIVNSTDFSPANTLKKAGLNDKLDRLTIYAQEGRRDIDANLARSLRAAMGETFADLPAAVTRANQVFRFDAAGQPRMAPPTEESAAASQDAAATAVAARDIALGARDDVLASALASGGMMTQSGAGAEPVAVAKHFQDRIFTPEQFTAEGAVVDMRATVTTTKDVVTVTVPGANFTADHVGLPIALEACGVSVAATCSVAAPGNSFVDALVTMTLVGGTKTVAAQLFATTALGAIAAFNQFTDIGEYSTVPANPVPATSSDAGVNATFTVGWRVLPHVSTIAQVNGPDSVDLTDAPHVSLAARANTRVVFGADETAAVLAAVAGAVAMVRTGKPATLRLARGYITSQSIDVNLLASDGKLTVDGGGMLYVANAAGNSFGLRVKGPGDVLGSLTNFTADAGRGAKQVQIANGSNQIKTGDLVVITARNLYGFDYAMANQAQSVSGNTIALKYPLRFPIVGAYPTSIQAFGAARKFTIKDVDFDGFMVRGKTVVGCLLQAHDGATARNVKCRNFNTAGSEGFAAYQHLRHDIAATCEECGGDTGTYAMHASYASAGRVALHAVKSWGFGVNLIGVSGCYLDISSDISSGRGVKLQGSCGTIGGRIDQSESGAAIWTGVAFEASGWNELDDVGTYANSGTGLWSNGTGSIGNRIKALRFGLNGVDIALAAGDDNWQVWCGPETAAPTITNASSGSHIYYSGLIDLTADMRGILPRGSGGTGAQALGYPFQQSGTTLYGGLSFGGVPPAGRWFGGLVQQPSITTTLALAADTLYAVPVIVPDVTTFSKIAIKVTAAAASGKLARLGIYNWANGLPTTLIADFGTTFVDTTGLKTPAIAITLPPGCYAVAVVTNGTPTVIAGSLIGAVPQIMIGIVDADFGAGTVTGQISCAYAFAALPANFGSVSYAAAIAPVIALAK